MLLSFWQTHKVFFKTFAICFAFMLLILSFAPPFSSDAHAVALVDDGIFMIIIALLAACGITITADSSQTALEWVSDAVNDFCTSAGTVWDTVKAGFRVGVNKLGDILANNSLLTWFTDFVEWLRGDLSLEDDTDTPIIEPVEGNLFLGPYPVYPLPLEFTRSSRSTFFFSSSDAVYAYFEQVPHPVLSDSSFAVYLFSPVSTSYTSLEVTGNQQFTNTLSLLLLTSSGFYVRNNYQASVSTTSSSPPDSRYIYNTAPFSDVMGEPYTLSSTPGSVDFVTASVGTMDIPVDGTDFDDEDGTLVTGIGSWGDSLDEILEKIREWLDAQSPAGVFDPVLEIAPEADVAGQIEPDLLSPENWPAIIPPLSLHDFSFNSIWHYVTDWLSSFSGTLSYILGITFSLPAVSIVYAVIVISLALWLIRRATQ